MSAFERATFGNKDGSHQLLKTTVTAGGSTLDQLRFLVDRPAGHVDSSVTWSPYWGCQPVDTWWVLWRGEEDLDAPRKNMVKVEVVLLPISQCGLLDDLDELLVAVGHTGDDRNSDDALQLSGTIVQRLSTKAPPVVVRDIGWAPSLLRALWPRLWASARASLSLRTVFAAEYLGAAFSPKIALVPTELTTRWRGYPILTSTEPLVGPASQWFSGNSLPQFERLMKANSERLPSDFSILGRVERIVERLENLHAGNGTVSDALIVARSQEAFPEGFNLPSEDVDMLSSTLSELREANVGNIRTASLTKLDQVTNLGEVEAALAGWIQMFLPAADDHDALWILKHHLSQDHVLWWRNGVSRGLSAAFTQRHSEWARALWHWWTESPNAVEWTDGYLDGSAAVEVWLANYAPAEVHDDLLKKLLGVCRKFKWATLLARTLGSSRPLVKCINIMMEALRQPEKGIKGLLIDRGDTEIVAAAVATNWPPLVARAAEATRTQPKLFECVGGTPGPGLIPLLLAHLKCGGDFPSDLVKSDFLVTVFDGVLQRNQQFVDVAGFLGVSAGASALDHPSADQLLDQVNTDVVSGAATEWWARFFVDDRLGAPPTALRSAIIDTARVQCESASITLIVRLLKLLPEIPERVFISWMEHTGFFWDAGDHRRLASLLLARKWRLATKTFRYSWKREHQVVAWHARDLLLWSDSFWLGRPSEVDATAVKTPKLIKISKRRTMKITFLASNPISSNRLALDEEARLIEQKVRGSKHRDQVDFRTRWAQRPEDLQQALLEDEPMIVHFSGHGGGAIGIVLHSEDQNDERLVAENALTDLFRIFKDNIRVVVLNACYSEVQAKAIVQEIDFVIGMSDSVGDEAARFFAAAFYRGLAFGKSIQSAFDLGLNELRLVGLGHEDHIPQLLVRSGVDPSTTVLVGGASS